MADIAMLKGNGIRYYEDRTARRNTTTDKEGTSEPSKDGGSEQEIARMAIEVANIIETSSAAGRKGKADREMSLAAAKELRRIDKAIQQEKEAAPIETGPVRDLPGEDRPQMDLQHATLGGSAAKQRLSQSDLEIAQEY